MTAPLVFYVPLLHPECVPARVRERVLCVPCGLPESFAASGSGPAGLEAREAVRRALPLGPAQSRAVLEELLRLGEEHAPSGILRQVSSLRRMDDASREEKSGEMAALDAFAVSGQAGASAGKNAPAPDEEQRQALLDSQKLLLLAHSLEERMLELARLEGRFSRAEELLYAALGEDDAEEAYGFGQRDAPLSGDEAESLALPVSWRLVVEAMLAFLPDKAALFTADAAMIQDLHAEESLRPLPEDRLELVSDWPEGCVRGLLYARLPAWRLAGKRACPAERPWLNKECEVLAAGPADGPSV